MFSTPRTLFTAIVALSTLVAAAPPGRAGPAGGVSYHPPVDAPVTDPFRAPEHRYGPGNRGIEYATEPDMPVAAVAAGEVTFAGQVGGSLHLTVRHADGLRSTLSFLATIGVGRGDHVDGGQVIGRSGTRTHLGIRAGDEYLDPAALFVGATGGVRLVPTDTAPSSVAEERAAVARWLAERPGFREGTADWLRGRALDAAALSSSLGSALDPTGFGLRTGLALVHRFRDRPPCTPAHAPVAVGSERRVVVLVGGLGSTSGDAAVDDVDASALGYRPEDVYRFSYEGGRTPDPTDRRQDIVATPYTASDSQADLVESGLELAALIDELARLEPGVAVDVVAHSQGGLVARLALLELDAAGRTGPLGAVVTLGTPHQGADLATAAAAVRTDLGASLTFGVINDVAGSAIELDSPAVHQLAVGSGLTDRLARSRVPEGVRLTSVGARGDLVVASNRSQLDGAANITVPLVGLHAHEQLPGDPATNREIALAIAGSPPTCESNRDIVLDVLSGRLVSETEQLMAAGLFVGGATVPG